MPTQKKGKKGEPRLPKDKELHFRYLIKSNAAMMGDVEFIRITRNHPEVNAGLFRDVLISRIDQEQWFSNVYCDNQNQQIYVAVDKKTQQQIGYVQFTRNLIDRNVEAGYVVHPNYGGRGFGTRLVRWSIEFLKTPGLLPFDELKGTAHKVWLLCLASNKKAIKIYYKCGFKLDGVLPDHIFKNGKYEGVVNMSMIIQ